MPTVIRLHNVSRDCIRGSQKQEPQTGWFPFSFPFSQPNHKCRTTSEQGPGVHLRWQVVLAGRSEAKGQRAQEEVLSEARAAPRFVPTSCLSKFGEVPLEALAMEHK